jgi:hypothetical protein
MLLQELTGVKKYHNMSWYDLTKKLEQETGIKPVANGRYGVIFTKPEWNYVIKIFDEDPEYLGFVDFVLSHPNKHYPKIIKKPMTMHHFHSRDPSSTYKFYIVKIEKLYPVSEEMGGFLEIYLPYLMEVYYRQYVMDQSDQNYKYDGDSAERTFNGPFGKKIKTSYVGLFEQMPWLKSLSKAYWKVMAADLGAEDMHKGNIMQRKDGTIVLIDPVWAGESFFQRAARAERSEYDDYGDDEPDEQITGPTYLKKNQPKPPEPKKETHFVGPDDPRIPF